MTHFRGPCAFKQMSVLVVVAPVLIVITTSNFVHVIIS